MGLATNVNIKDRQAVIQGFMMMMIMTTIFRVVAQSAVNNTKPKHKMIFDVIWLLHKDR